MQIVGMAPLALPVFNLDIEVPISRRDTGNHEKALCDLCESCGVVTNDGNAHRITVTPTNRTDCLLAFTPLPAMDGVLKQAATDMPGRTWAHPEEQAGGADVETASVSYPRGQPTRRGHRARLRFNGEA